MVIDVRGAEMRYIAIAIDVFVATLWAYSGNVPMTVFFLILAMVLILSD